MKKSLLINHVINLVLIAAILISFSIQNDYYAWCITMFFKFVLAFIILTCILLAFYREIKLNNHKQVLKKRRNDFQIRLKKMNGGR